MLTPVNCGAIRSLEGLKGKVITTLVEMNSVKFWLSASLQNLGLPALLKFSALPFQCCIEDCKSTNE